MTSTSSTTAATETPQHSESSLDRPSYDDINVPVILMVGIISTIVTICTIFFVQGLTYQWKNSYVRDRSLDVVNKSVADAVESQKAVLLGEADGVTSIEESMKQVISRYGSTDDDDRKSVDKGSGE